MTVEYLITELVSAYHSLGLRMDYMIKSQYIDNLENEIKSKGYGEYYTAKCIRYANRLLDNNLPVIFDTKHLALLIGISAEDLVKMIYCQDLFYKKAYIPKKVEHIESWTCLV